MTKQLQPVDLVSPGFLGLNFAQSGAVLPPAYATRATNAVLDTAGRLAARKGYTDITSTDIGSNPAIKTLFEYNTPLGGQETIVAWDGGIANSVANPAGNDISGSVTDSDGRWNFQNFVDVAIGFQDGQKPIRYTGSGNFATIVESAGTAPTVHNGVGLCAYGRVWALDSDGKTIKYSDLLDETAWSGTGAGSIDMTSVWTDGTDEVTAITAFNGALVVFGKKHVVFWVDGQGSANGLNPELIYLADVITGTGCLSQYTIAPVGETDLLFLSPSGVQSIKRIVAEKSNPVITLTKAVRDEFLLNLNLESDKNAISGVYDPLNGFYLLTMPTQGITWVLDQRRRYRDDDGDELSVITQWDLAPASWLSRDDNTLLLGDTFGVGLYGAIDDAGTAFRFVYQSPWLDIGEDFANRLKILKRIGAILFVRNDTSIVFKWAVDFDDATKSLTRSVNSDASAEYGVAEYNSDEFSGGLTLRIIKVPARGTGQYYRLGIEADVNGQFALQQAELFTKIGRLA